MENKLPFVWVIPGRISELSDSILKVSPVTIYWTDKTKQPENLSWKEFTDLCKKHNIHVSKQVYYSFDFDNNAKEIELTSIKFI